MSTPIVMCRVFKAARGDEKTFSDLVETMDHNASLPAFSVWPCECKPPCEKPTEEQMDKFNERLADALNKRGEERAKSYRKPDPEAFSKWIFPVIKNMPKRTPN